MAALLRAGLGHGSGAFLNDLLGHKSSPHRRITSTDDLPSLSEIVRNLSLTFWLAFTLYASLVAAFFAFRSSRAPPSPSADEIRELKDGEVAPSAAFFKWGRKYGPLVSFKSGFKTVVVLNDLTLLTDLFHKYSSTHTAKPRRVVADEILSASLRGQSSGPPFARWRKALDDGLNETASRSYRDLILDASVRLLREFLDDGDGDHRRALERFVDGVLLGVCYGTTVTEGDATAHGEAKETYHDACKPSQHAPDTFPILARLPTRIYNPAWRQSIYTARDRTTKLYLAALRSARGPSVASIAGADKGAGKGGKREEEVAYAVVSPFVEGREPLLWSLQWCIAALLIFPATQTTLQTSLDAQIPRTRLPTSSDVASLPRLRSFVKECARYWPVVPLLRREVEKGESVTVKVQKGGVSEVYVVEKGAEIVANVDAIAKSDALFPSARDFDPERFMSPTAHDTDFIFGSGMRVCPGRHVAEEAVSLALARILWAFEITQAKDGEIPPGNAFSYRSDGGARGPAPFRFALRARGEGVEGVVRGESGS